MQSQAVTFDTHAFVKRLTRAGMPEDQAEIIAWGQARRNEHLATQPEDLKALELTLKNDLEQVQAALKHDLERVQAALKHELEEHKAANRQALKEALNESILDSFRARKVKMRFPPCFKISDLRH